MSQCVVEALAHFLQESEFSLDEVSPFLVVEVVRTGQIWVYEVEPFLQNLAHVPTVRERARQALERLTARREDR